MIESNGHSRKLESRRLLWKTLTVNTLLRLSLESYWIMEVCVCIVIVLSVCVGSKRSRKNKKMINEPIRVRLCNQCSGLALTQYKNYFLAWGARPSDKLYSGTVYFVFRLRFLRWRKFRKDFQVKLSDYHTICHTNWAVESKILLNIAYVFFNYSYFMLWHEQNLNSKTNSVRTWNYCKRSIHLYCWCRCWTTVKIFCNTNLYEKWFENCWKRMQIVKIHATCDMRHATI